MDRDVAKPATMGIYVSEKASTVEDLSKAQLLARIATTTPAETSKAACDQLIFDKDWPAAGVIESVIFNECSWAGDRSAPPGDNPFQFVNCFFNNCTFSDISRVRFIHCTFNKCTWTDELQELNFESTGYPPSKLLTMLQPDWLRKTLESPIKPDVSDRDSEAVKSLLACCEFRDATISKVGFTGTDLISVNFKRVIGQTLKVHSSFHCGGGFSECEVHAATWDNTALIDVMFDGIEFDASTQFTRVVLRDCAMHRFALASLSNNGGLTAAQISDLMLIDPVGELRRTYNWTARVIQAASFLAFIAPYAAFIGIKWVSHLRHRNSNQVETELLVAQLWHYLADKGWLGMTLVGVAVVCHSIRFGLSTKTAALERDEEIKGVPSRFSLSDRLLTVGRRVRWHITWRHLMRVAKACVWINVIAAVIHTLLFLWTEVPR